MSKDRNGTRWSEAEVARMKALADGNTPTRLIAHKLDRSTAAVQTQ